MNSLLALSSTPSMAKIVIRIQYHGKRDDVLVIEPDMESFGFVATFVQVENNVQSSFGIAERGVTAYLDNFFRTLRFDNDASFACVQVDMPGLPCCILKKSDLLDYLYEVVDDHLEELYELDDWPMEQVAVSRASTST
jgi:hypothetical protein